MRMKLNMGYYMSVKESNWHIEKGQIPGAIKALREWASSKKYICWADKDLILKAKSLTDIMVELNYQPIFDEEGNVTDMEFFGKWAGDEDQIFKVLASYSIPGSYIEFLGEDGFMWRYEVTDDKSFRRLTGRTVWE
jgi:hypothetical protein